MGTRECQDAAAQPAQPLASFRMFRGPTGSFVHAYFFPANCSYTGLIHALLCACSFQLCCLCCLCYLLFKKVLHRNTVREVRVATWGPTVRCGKLRTVSSVVRGWRSRGKPEADNGNPAFAGREASNQRG